jgi:hypothetical protein
MTDDRSRAIQYLLGTLPEAEADALGERMFASDDTFSALEDAENTLIEAYLDDELSPDDRARFESLFRASTHLHERLELERALRARLGSAGRPRSRTSWLPWAAAIALGLTGGGLALRENRQAARDLAAGATRERTLEARVAERDERLRVLEQRLADHDAAPAIETWRLTGGGQRAAGGAAAFAVSSGLIRLRVPEEEAAAGATYRARLASPEGRELLAIDGLAAVSESGRTFVDVLVPGALLPRGTYILFLTRVGAAGAQELGPYSFGVRPR